MCRTECANARRNLADHGRHTLMQVQMLIMRLSATPVAHSEVFGSGPDSVGVEALAKKVLSYMDLPHRPYVAPGPPADMPE